MPPNRFVERLRELFFAADAAEFEDRLGHPGIRASSNDQTANLRQLFQQLEDTDATTSIMTGCVQLLGLDRVKQRLGAHWDQVSDRAMLIAQETLNRDLGPQDVCRVLEDSSFQICFETSDDEIAKASVARISAAIEAQIAAELLGAEGNLSVRGFAAPVPYAKIRDAVDPLTALHSSLLEIRDQVSKREVKTRSLSALSSAGALFQPLWCSGGFGHTINRCLLDTVAGAAAARQLEDIKELDDLVEALSSLDCVVFAKSIEGLHGALGDSKRATILVPVHFQTLVLAEPEFLKMTGALPQSYRRSVLIDLIGVPTASSGKEVLNALKRARAIADRIVLQMSPTDRRVHNSVRNLIWGLSKNLSEFDYEDHSQAIVELSRFAEASAEHGLYSFAYGANTMGKAAAVVRAGFDYVGGTAVAHTASVPRPHARFTPLFGDARPKSMDKTAGLREHERFAPLDPKSAVTLPDGQQHACRIPNVSASGAVVICSTKVKVRDYLVIGSIPAQVVRTTKRGFAVRFLEVQQPSTVEIALRTPIAGDSLLESLRRMAA